MPTKNRPTKTNGARPKTQRIAALNDKMRKNPRMHGDVWISEGIAALGEKTVEGTLKRIAAFKRGDFEGYLDPYGERRFGALWIDGRLAYFQIGYYAKDDLREHTDDASDPAQTARIMKVSFWDEQGERA